MPGKRISLEPTGTLVQKPLAKMHKILTYYYPNEFSKLSNTLKCGKNHFSYLFLSCEAKKPTKKGLSG